MLFICYFEILPEKIDEVSKSTISHSVDAGCEGIKVIFEGVSATHWGIAAFEAENEEAVFRFIRPWTSLNGKLIVAPALRVDNGEYAERFPTEILKSD
jgi:phenylpyruvate tautomerase PptA (4-oxalocrotonate tautomerase family)